MSRRSAASPSTGLMTSMALEHFGTPASRNEARELAYLEDWAVDDLSGRTTWCATASSERRSAGEILGRLHGFAGRRHGSGERRVDPRELNVAAAEPLLELAQRLYRMLRGARGPASRLVPGD